MPAESLLIRLVLRTAEVPDRDLLARFVAARDEEAFAEIVRRHGPMVLAACRRVTHHPHDAEDAFQAAFLVLARRAGHVARPELLANWLYGVAYRTALEARAARRRAEERVVPVAPEPVAPPPPDDTTELRAVIDEELAKLPDKYRSAVVLCDLEGLPRATAAAQLGIPEGTLSSRLAHARKVLAERLTRRGVTASATAVVAALGRDALAAAVPYTLTHATLAIAVRTPLAVSPAVSSLTDGVLKTMLANRLRNAFGIGLLLCGVVGVGTTLASQLRTELPADPVALPPAVAADPLEEAAAPQPKAAPKKYAAKGVEDDDVPYGTFPAQGVVRAEDGKLIVRQRTQSYVAVTNGTTVVRHVGSHVVTTTHDTADVTVFDMKGNRLSAKAWKELFKSDVHALVAHDGKLPNPRELVLFKQDALLVVLPATAEPPVAPTLTPGYGVPATTRPAPAVLPPTPNTRPMGVKPAPALPGTFAPPTSLKVEPARPGAPVLPPYEYVPFAQDELPAVRP